jgi:hypothetical protein
MEKVSTCEGADFQLFPTEFDIESGSTIQLQGIVIILVINNVVSFCPLKEGAHSQELRVHFDNFTQTYFISGFGSIPSLVLQSINDHEVEEGETTSWMFFDSVIAGSRELKTVVLRNQSFVPMDFEWKLFEEEYQVSTTCPFKISPVSGTLSGSEPNYPFSVTFNPLAISGYYKYKALLCVKNIPQATANIIQERSNITSSYNDPALSIPLIDLTLVGSSRSADILTVFNCDNSDRDFHFSSSNIIPQTFDYS